jgi:hypothetical protein
MRTLQEVRLLDSCLVRRLALGERLGLQDECYVTRLL